MPSATYICHLHVSHVFDDISREGDEHRLDRKAERLHCAHPQNQQRYRSGPHVEVKTIWAVAGKNSGREEQIH